MLLTSRPGRKVADRLKRFRRDRSGVALIEFCLALPVLLTLTLTGIETANLAIAVLRVNQLAMMASDNAGRVRSSIDEQDVNEIMAGIRFAGSGIGFGANGRVIISSLEGNGQPSPRTGNKITWQRCFGAKNVTSSYGVQGAGTNDASLAAGMGPAAQKIVPVPNSALIFAEIRYTYRPVVVSAFMANQELSAIQAFTVRDRAQQTLTNTTSLPASAQRLCDTAHLSAT